MGGSKGGPWKDVDPKKLAQDLRKTEKKELDSAYETDVNEFLAKHLVEYNDRDVDTIKKILDTVISDLGDEVEGAVNLLFGGSVSKHTYVNGMSDIDALVILDRTDLSGQSSEKLRGFLGKILEDRYGKENVTVGNLAISIKTQGHSIQLLPALRIGEGFKISSGDGKGWSSIRPQKFAESLTKSNQENGGKVVPTIKLAKALIDTLPQKQQLTGYHVEALAIQAFKKYSGPQTPKAMLEHFFEKASPLVKKPIADITGQSVHVDDYLGPQDSVRRRAISLALDRISRRMKNADGMHSIEQWEKLLD